jgi:hypothetical protein
MCADIHDGQEHKRSVKGRIQKRKTNQLHIIIFCLQRAAGPYRWARSDSLNPSTSKQHPGTAVSPRDSMAAALKQGIPREQITYC